MFSSFTKQVVALNAAVPLMLLAWDAAHGHLGANPINFAIRTTGILSLIFLVLTMAITPVINALGWHAIGTFRRTFGLYAFFHAALHFAIFFFYDRAGNVADTLSEIRQRTYLWVGIVGLVIMVPLAVTSTNGMIRWMGPTWWKRLHRLAYIAAAAGALHFFLLVKADTTRPIVYGSLLVAFFAWRLGRHYWQLHKRANQPVLATRPTFWTGQLRVVRIFSETADVKTFRFMPTTGDEFPFVHKPGQYLNLTLMIDGQAVRRSYTISSSPTRSAYCEITVKREANGLASRYLHDKIREGDVLTVSAPAGQFIFTGREAMKLVLIGGGVGITPLMAKIRHLTDRGWGGPIHLIFSIRTPADLIFEHELRELAKRHPNLKLTLTCTRDSNEQWTGEKGRIDEAMLRRLIPDWLGTRIHLCGPTEMTAPLIATLMRMGVPSSQIKDEAFTSPSRATSNGPATTKAEATGPLGGTVTFAKSGQSISDPQGRIVLEVAEAAGVSIPFDCRSGICGQCKTRLIDGEVVMEAEDALTSSDRAGGLILACQARCRGDITLDA